MIETGAIFDKRRRYRYKLWRKWDESLPPVAYVMLNPSKADAEHNDQTIRTCISLAKRFGFGSMEVVNLFAFCATYPADLRAARNPVGKLNDEYLLAAVQNATSVILAWGNHGSIRQRHENVLDLLSKYDEKLFCLGVTKGAHPRHPLYTPSSVVLQSFSKLACQLDAAEASSN